jgi:hypothetical protein
MAAFYTPRCNRPAPGPERPFSKFKAFACSMSIGEDAAKRWCWCPLDARPRSSFGDLAPLLVNRFRVLRVVRLARQFPSRVIRVLTFDIIYTGVPEQFEPKFEAAIAAHNTKSTRLSLESHRRAFQARELGTWSAALERDFEEQTEKPSDGALRYAVCLKDGSRRLPRTSGTDATTRPRSLTLRCSLSPETSTWSD